MSWLLGARGLVLDLEEDRKLLGALAVLAVLAPERPGLDPGAVDALMDLFVRNADGDRGARIRLGELLAGYSPMDPSQIGDPWRRLPRNPDALSREQLRPLLCPLDMLGRGPCEDLDTRVVWPVVGGTSSVDEQASAKVRVMLGARRRPAVAPVNAWSWTVCRDSRLQPVLRGVPCESAWRAWPGRH